MQTFDESYEINEDLTQAILEKTKTPIVTDGCPPYTTHRSSFSTLPVGRLLCGLRACPSRTLYEREIL